MYWRTKWNVFLMYVDVIEICQIRSLADSVWLLMSNDKSIRMNQTIATRKTEIFHYWLCTKDARNFVILVSKTSANFGWVEKQTKRTFHYYQKPQVGHLKSYFGKSIRTATVSVKFGTNELVLKRDVKVWSPSWSSLLLIWEREGRRKWLRNGWP